MVDEYWLTMAKSLRCGASIRIECCAKDNSMIISHDVKGYSGFCFRCDEKKWYPHGTKSMQLIHQQKEDLKWIHTTTVQLPSDYTKSIPNNVGWLWMLKAGVSTQLQQLYKIGWSENLQRIVLPTYSLTGRLVYVQGRAVHSTQKPKYLNRASSSVRAVVTRSLPHCMLSCFPLLNDTVVIVEDFLSTIRVGRITPAVSILGTTLTDERLSIISSQYNQVVLWMDGDKAGRDGVKKAKIKLDLCGIPYRVIETTKDPKMYSNREIQEILS